ncbi:RNA recognition motif domain-containing protein [Marinilabilia salmonicolor]|uniref:RNA recognition motif domain-containing protein n=1 Tax=Marinilabilia salmonicolor TaxID=989 RepID=UPI0004682EFD|nr:RNA-binding protein [Marinilabilia salmonicolor]
MNIFVAKLSSRTKSEDLEQMFGEFGEVTSAKVIMDRETGYSKRFGFVEMPDDSAANAAIENLDDKEFDGSHIVVKKARPREEAAGRGGGRQFRQSR